MDRRIFCQSSAGLKKLLLQCFQRFILTLLLLLLLLLTLLC